MNRFIKEIYQTVEMFKRVCANVAVRCVESWLEFRSHSIKYFNERCLQTSKFFVWSYMKSAENTIQREREQWMLGVGQFWWSPTYPSSVPTTIILSPFPFDGRLNYSNLKFETKVTVMWSLHLFCVVNYLSLSKMSIKHEFLLYSMQAILQCQRKLLGGFH